MITNGVSPALVKEALGHASLNTTMGYMHLVRENLLGLVDGPPSMQDLNALVGPGDRAEKAGAV